MIPHPGEIRIFRRTTAGPVECGDALRIVLHRGDGGSVTPGMAFSMTIGHREGAPIAVENRKTIDPGISLHYPRAEVFIARITLLDKDGGVAWRLDSTQLNKGMLAHTD